MSQYLIAVGIILVLLTTWVVVQHLARAFATRHPELGPAREEGGGCGKTCGCSMKERNECAQGKGEKDVEKNAV